MAPRKLDIPEQYAEDWAIYRGDDWDPAKFRFQFDISAYTFACTLKHSRLDNAGLDVTIRTDHQFDPPDDQDPTNNPYISLHLDGADTATISENLLYGDLQGATNRTLFTFVVPVLGQYTVTSA